MSKNDNSISKARLWVGIGYPENMIDGWQDDIGDKLQVPYAYCVHDQCQDKNGDPRKEHVHLIIAFNNTTTLNHALDVLNTLSCDGKKAFSTCEAVINARHAYDYLIHDTEDCKKKNKKLYDASKRICGNGFDIGCYEQLSAARKAEITKELCFIIREKKFSNFMDFFGYCSDNLSDEYFEVLDVKSAFLERLIKGNYHKYCKQVIENDSSSY